MVIVLRSDPRRSGIIDEGWLIISRFEFGIPARRLYSALVRRFTIWAPFLAKVQARIVVQRFLKQRGL